MPAPPFHILDAVLKGLHSPEPNTEGGKPLMQAAADTNPRAGGFTTRRRL